MAGYNGGPNRIRRLWKENGGGELDSFVETMTLDESRDYVKRVLVLADSYRQLYPLATAASGSSRAARALSKEELELAALAKVAKRPRKPGMSPGDLQRPVEPPNVLPGPRNLLRSSGTSCAAPGTIARRRDGLRAPRNLFRAARKGSRRSATCSRPAQPIPTLRERVPKPPQAVPRLPQAIAAVRRPVAAARRALRSVHLIPNDPACRRLAATRGT